MKNTTNTNTNTERLTKYLVTMFCDPNHTGSNYTKGMYQVYAKTLQEADCVVSDLLRTYKDKNITDIAIFAQDNPANTPYIIYKGYEWVTIPVCRKG